METKANLTSFWRRQPPSRRQPPLRKVQKLGQNKARVTGEQQQRSSSKMSYPLTTAKPIKRPGVIVPVTKPMSPSQGKIPPFNPAVKGMIPPFNPNATRLKKVRARKQALPKKTGRSRKTRLKPIARTILYVMRLLIVGVGIGAIVGTVLSVFDPASRITPAGSQSNTTVEQAQSQQNSNNSASGVSLSEEIVPLKTALQNVAAGNPNLIPGIFLVDLDNGAYVDINSSSTFPAASTIKVPILVAFFQDVDAGKIHLDETMTMQREMVVGGSGDLQYKHVGTKFTVLELVTKMITISDNTAANMLMTRLGGMESLNQRFQSWGLTNTAVRSPLPDLQGTNSTSPKDLGTLMAMVSKGNLVSMPSRDRILDIMRHTVRSNLLPTGLGPRATIAHKTGDIGTMLADAGLVDLPTGKRYIISVMVQRPNNDVRAEKLIGSISRAAYQQFSPNTTAPSNTGSTIPTNGYQSPAINPTLRTNTGNLPVTGYQPPMVSAPQYNGTLPMPVTGYQPPMVSAPQYNGNLPMPVTGYQPPMINQQYYYPYQR